MNLKGPKILGDDKDMRSLRSWVRRILVVNLDSSYTTHLSEANVSNKVFLEETELKKFLGSPSARLVYTRKILMPFLRKHSREELLEHLCSPPERIQKDTEDFVKEMAKREWTSDTHEADGEAPEQRTERAMEILCQFHGGKEAGAKFQKTRRILDSKCIPVQTGGGRYSKLTTFWQLTQAFPLLCSPQ